MRVLGIILVLVALASGLMGMFHAAMPFRVPLTADDAWHAALVLLIAGALALAAGER